MDVQADLHLCFFAYDRFPHDVAHIMCANSTGGSGKSEQAHLSLGCSLFVISILFT